MNPDYVQSLQTSHHFPADLTYRLFPSELAYLIDDLYESTQLPLELIFNTVLATLSLSCQSLVDVVHPHTNMPEPCSLYLLAIAEPGRGKNNDKQTGDEPLLRICRSTHSTIRREKQRL